MENTNGFFGSITGSFNAGEDIVDIITQQCISPFSYLSKIGICYKQNFDLDIQGKSYPKIIVLINDDDNTHDKKFQFQLGKTGILELEDVQITSIKFEQDIDNVTIDYQYK